eukprot:9479883-Pyramimonas_sp.AAC.1
MIRAKLRQVLRQFLQSSYDRKVYLDLFSGTGTIADCMKFQGESCISFDVLNGPEYDLSNAVVVNVLIGWIQSGIVKGVFAAFPCSSWTPALFRQIRRSWCPYGIPDPTPAEAVRLNLGNSTLMATRRLVRACIKQKVPMLRENPHASKAWREPNMAALMGHPSCRQLVLDQCAFGARWRKRTRFVGWHVPMLRQENVLCSGH